jgi:hypothetical protein
LEVLILHDFKSFAPEVLILGNFKSLFPEVLILVNFKALRIREMQKFELFLEVLILEELKCDHSELMILHALRADNSNWLRANMQKFSRDTQYCQLEYEYSKGYQQGGALAGAKSGDGARSSFADRRDGRTSIGFPHVPSPRCPPPLSQFCRRPKATPADLG